MHWWHQPFLGVRDIPAWLPQFEVEAFFTFDAIELAAIRLRRTTDHAFGLALQIGFLRMSGRCLNGVRMLPRAVLMHIGLQIGAAPAQLASAQTLLLGAHDYVTWRLCGARTTDYTTAATTGLLEDARPPLAADIQGLGDLAGNLADTGDVLEGFLQLAPTKIDLITRTAINGSWFNFFVCGAGGFVRLPVSAPLTGQPAGINIPAGGLNNGEQGCGG